MSTRMFICNKCVYFTSVPPPAVTWRQPRVVPSGAECVVGGRRRPHKGAKTQMQGRLKHAARFPPVSRFQMITN